MVLALQPAAQEAGHEAVARPQHIIDLDGKARADDALVERIGNVAGVDHAAHRPALQHDHRGRQRPDDAQRFQRVLRAGGNVHFFFRPDDQVAVGKDRLHVLGHLVRLDVALFARTVACEAPEVWAVVDVEDHLRATGLGDPHCLALCGIGVRLGEVSARHQHRGRGFHEILVDVGLVQGAIGTVVAIEDERKCLVVLDREQHQRGQALLVGDDAIQRHALARHLLLHVAPHLLVADARDDGGLQAQPRRADGDVRGTAAHRLGEGRHVLEPGPDLLPVEIDRAPADGDDVKPRLGA